MGREGYRDSWATDTCVGPGLCPEIPLLLKRLGKSHGTADKCVDMSWRIDQYSKTQSVWDQCQLKRKHESLPPVGLCRMVPFSQRLLYHMLSTLGGGTIPACHCPSDGSPRAEQPLFHPAVHSTRARELWVGRLLSPHSSWDKIRLSLPQYGEVLFSGYSVVQNGQLPWH